MATAEETAAKEAADKAAKDAADKAAKEVADKAFKEEANRKAAEKEEAEKKAATAKRENENVTQALLDEWQEFKSEAGWIPKSKRKTDETKPKTKPHSHTCILGPLCADSKD